MQRRLERPLAFTPPPMVSMNRRLPTLCRNEVSCRFTDKPSEQSCS
jgi:hypothetical protein